MPPKDKASDAPLTATPSLPPATQKKKVVKKGPAYLTGEADLQAFGIKTGACIRNALGQTGIVLGVKYERPGQADSAQVWVRWDGSGLDAPVDTLDRFARCAPPNDDAGGLATECKAAGLLPAHAPPGFQPCAPAEALQREAAVLAADRKVLAAQWAEYEQAQAKKAAAAAKAAEKKKKKKELAAEGPADQQLPARGAAATAAAAAPGEAN
eukprot:scaffold23.g4136.t1